MPCIINVNTENQLLNARQETSSVSDAVFCGLDMSWVCPLEVTMLRDVFSVEI